MKFYNPIFILKSLYLIIKGFKLLLSPQPLESIPFFEKSINYAQGNVGIISDCEKYIGIAYLYAQQYEKAKDYLLEAEKIVPNKYKIKMDPDLSGNLGIIYDNEARTKEIKRSPQLAYDAELDFRKAKEYYELAIKNFKNKHELINIDYIKSRLAMINDRLRKSEGV